MLLTDLNERPLLYDVGDCLAPVLNYSIVAVDSIADIEDFGCGKQLLK